MWSYQNTTYQPPPQQSANVGKDGFKSAPPPPKRPGAQAFQQYNKHYDKSSAFSNGPTPSKQPNQPQHQQKQSISTLVKLRKHGVNTSPQFVTVNSPHDVEIYDIAVNIVKTNSTKMDYSPTSTSSTSPTLTQSNRTIHTGNHTDQTCNNQPLFPASTTIHFSSSSDVKY
jgi:hypothetical protein